ncbi:uncharacterized protein LOC130284993 [Hyla sarda]|uniref:uncharacterized protein LOC130284993 n=1 Tax=Hyla sarda TaxID=327740 RepID=UPI0024C39D0F|nr:uncharacterized protein LOC130284993 [Hyla sarda]
MSYRYRKRKKPGVRLRNLTDFYSGPGAPGFQDGAGSSSPARSEAAAPRTAQWDDVLQEQRRRSSAPASSSGSPRETSFTAAALQRLSPGEGEGDRRFSSHSAPASPLSGSPLKQRQKLQEDTAAVTEDGVKDQLMTAARKLPPLQGDFVKITLYTDVSAATLQQRRAFQPITSVLREHKILYRWGFPVRLLVQRDNALHVIRSVEEGNNFLAKWKLASNQVSANPRSQPSRVTSEWQVVGSVK